MGRKRRQCPVRISQSDSDVVVVVTLMRRSRTTCRLLYTRMLSADRTQRCNAHTVLCSALLCSALRFRLALLDRLSSLLACLRLLGTADLRRAGTDGSDDLVDCRVQTADAADVRGRRELVECQTRLFCLPDLLDCLLGPAGRQSLLRCPNRLLAEFEDLAQTRDLELHALALCRSVKSPLDSGDDLGHVGEQLLRAFRRFE